MKAVVKFVETIGNDIFVSPDDVQAVKGMNANGDVLSHLYLKNGAHFGIREKIEVCLEKLGWSTEKKIDETLKKAKF